MNILTFLSGFACLLKCYINCNEIVRGIDPSKLGMYGASNDFRCFDGSMAMPRERVNDDYCDCADGTDEPGTSACPNGSFYCVNAGYKPVIVPSSRVGDGICDCCDGSDEYTGRVSCSNDCMELGKQLREDEMKRHWLLTEGYQLYQGLCQEGTSAKSEKQLRYTELEKEKEGLEAKRKELEMIREELEIPEKDAKDRHQQAWESEKINRREQRKRAAALEAFKELDANQDETVSVDEVRSHIEFDIDSNGEVSPEEAKEYLEDHDALNFDEFSEKVWENIRQIYRKPGESKPEEAPETTEAPPQAETTTPVPPSEEDEERYYGGDGEEVDDSDDEDDDDNKEEDQKPKEEGKKEDEDDDGEEMPAYDHTTQQLIAAADAARSDYDSHNNKVQEIEREMSEAKKLLDADLGPNNEFFALRGKCFDYSDREYVYTLCPFDKTSQRSKQGGMETSLGSWGSWSDQHGSKYIVMLYEHGQNCWNGPDRSTKVHLQCGAVNELVSVTEPNRCEYRFIFNTPSSCNQLPEPIPEQHQPHVEL